MPKIRVTEVVKLPTGTPRFPDVIPALKEALQVKIAEGKVTLLPQTWVNENGYTTTTTVNLWNNKSDYEAFRNWVVENYTLARTEYYYYAGMGHEGKTSYKVTVTEED